MTRASDYPAPTAARPDLGEVLASLRVRLDAAKVYLRLDDLIGRLGALEEAVRGAGPLVGR